MKHSELIKDKIYTDILDREIPLKFTGKIETRNQFNSYAYIAFFTPVKTAINKNYYNIMPTITKAFCEEHGNFYITEQI